jgi:hypothetical protein
MPLGRLLPLALLLPAALACASGPRIEVRTGVDRQFEAADRFAPANVGVLEMENPVLATEQLWDVQRALESAIGWRGLRMAVEEEADWLVSCAFRKRLKFPRDAMADDVVEPWRPTYGDPMGSEGRTVGTERYPSGTRAQTDGMAQTPPPQPWIETFIELRLRSRRTGTIAWSAERRWSRDRAELPEDELRETLQLLLGEVRVAGAPPAPSP